MNDLLIMRERVHDLITAGRPGPPGPPTITPGAVISTEGDLIVGGVDGAPTQLAKGATGRVVVAGSSRPEYSDALRIEPAAQGVNMVSGFASNAVNGGSANTISGGGTNTNEQVIAAGDYNTIDGGYDNRIDSTGIGASTIGGGAHHRIADTADHATIGGGSLNIVGGASHYGTIGGGTGNEITGAINNATIGGGVNNDVTATDATVSGGNANLASGMRSSIGGGTFHIAAGNDATVAGGNDNDAYGNGATVGGGQLNKAGVSGTPTNANYATIAGGLSNAIAASGQSQYAVIGGGRQNQINADYAQIPGGRENVVSGLYGHASGYGAVASRYGQHAQATGYFAAAGDAQTSVLVARRQTTNATATELRLEGSGQRITIPDDTTWLFVAHIVARRTDADNESAAYEVKGCLDRNAGTVALVGSVTTTVIAEDTAAWDVAATADNTNKALSLSVTGEAAKTINWVARVTLVEVTA